MKLYSIPAGFFKSDGGALFGTIPKKIWAKYHSPDEHNLCVMNTRCLLIEEDNKVILIDTGIGNKQDEKYLGHFHLHGNDSLNASLAKYKYSYKDITDVILTHLHFDHVGGAFMKDGKGNIVPTFPNALYWSNQEHWDWASINPNIREKASFLDENLLPMQASGKLKMIPVEDGFLFTKHIKIRFAYGHTHAMMLPQINYNGKTLLYIADLLPFTTHLPIPYFPAFDVRPLLTMQEKKKYLNEALKNNYTLFFEHDPYVECVSLENTEKGIRVKEQFTLSEWISKT